MKRYISIMAMVISLFAFNACNERYNDETEKMLQKYSSFISSNNVDSCSVYRNQLKNRKINNEQAIRLYEMDKAFEQMEEELRILEQLRREQEEKERVKRTFVGTYTIANCKYETYNVTHVPKNYFTAAMDVKTYTGYTTWDYQIVVRDDYSVCVRKVNIKDYDKYGRFEREYEARKVLEAGTLEVLSNNTFKIKSRDSYSVTLIESVPYYYVNNEGETAEKMGFEAFIEEVVIDVSNCRIYRDWGYENYVREGKGYEYVTYTK